AGTSFDMHELDAASHNRVDDARELLEHVALSTPGRPKLYVLDEVHMLTAQASAALLKTLEEPPAGVVFVLATTDPQKVLPTIRSRTQHFEFHLLPAAPLEEYVRSVVADAQLDVDDTAIDAAVRASGGSARDALPAPDQTSVPRRRPRRGRRPRRALRATVQHALHRDAGRRDDGHGRSRRPADRSRGRARPAGQPRRRSVARGTSGTHRATRTNRGHARIATAR